MRPARVMLLLGGLSLLGGCSKGKGWVVGQWLLVADGKPGVCYEFKPDRTYAVFTSPDCAGESDGALSGRWELKEATKLAIKRGPEPMAQLALISDQTDEKFVATGTLAGAFYRLAKGQTGSTLLKELEGKGVIKVKALPSAMGCDQLGKPVKDLRALPTESKPRMIRSRDQHLEYFVDRATGDPNVEKVVYALNQDQIDWVAFHLTPAAFAAPGPEGRLEQAIGQPEGQVSTGKGEKRQHISMWKSYCARMRGAANKDVDITLFAAAGTKDGLIYVSERVVSGAWDELKQAASDPEAQAPEGETAGAKPETAGAKPEAAKPAKPEVAKPAPKAAEARPAAEEKPAPAPPKPEKRRGKAAAGAKAAAAPAEKKTVAPPAQGAPPVKGSNSPTVPGRDDEI
ncbi:MAG: hypothetical protein IT371_21505 [Deltaproteobacteria bacterium]|nr:hypothetical protein [Deltaproteobacteria bacterium]